MRKEKRGRRAARLLAVALSALLAAQPAMTAAAAPGGLIKSQASRLGGLGRATSSDASEDEDSQESGTGGEEEAGENAGGEAGSGDETESGAGEEAGDGQENGAGSGNEAEDGQENGGGSEDGTESGAGNETAGEGHGSSEDGNEPADGEDPEEEDGSEEDAAPDREEAEDGLETLKPATASDAEEEPAPQSLLPLEEVDARLFLNDLSEEELKAVPVETLLKRLEDYEGNPVEIPDGAEMVWSFIKDENGDVIEDSYCEIDRGGTVDLSYWSNTYTLELIVGSGKQLDPGNVRYIVDVYILDIEETIEYSLYKDRDGHRGGIVSRDEMIFLDSPILEDEGVPVAEVTFIPYDYEVEEEGTTYRLSLDSDVYAEWDDLKVDVYPMADFLESRETGNLKGAITDEILNQDTEAEGYPGQYRQLDDLEHPEEADNLFCVVYSDAETGEMLAYQGLYFIVSPEPKNGPGRVMAYEDGQMKDMAEKYSSYYNFSDSWYIRPDGETNGVTAEVGEYSETYHLLDGYGDEKEGYYVLDENDKVEKILLGSFDSADEAEKEGAEDITARIMPSDRNEVPYGYPYETGRSLEYTIVFKDGTAMPCRMYVSRETTYRPEFDPAPATGMDPYFRVTGEAGYEGDGGQDSIFAAENDYDETLDTYYGYGYQTLFINDEDADLSSLRPVFWTPDGVEIHSGGKQESGVSEKDFSDGPVFYQAHIGDNLKNYQVTFAKKENGPKLFVNGPDEREIFLDEYFENRHDIMVANIGSEELTGLNAELIDPVNVRLDSYWTMGGENNESLAPFETAKRDDMANLAKVRLLPDGEGEVSGTLKISADGQEDVFIDLKGYAGNPKIITENLADGVKYVPYSYMVATNNMHDWNKVTFQIVKGKLPEGLKLYPATGEIYGVPLETGEFPIRVRADYSQYQFTPSYADLTLTIKENTNENVYNASDEGYLIENPIGTETAAGSRDYVVSVFSDQLFVSAGQYGEFQNLWLNGEKLADGEDYTKESGSTRITIKSQTFQTKAKSGSNTIAAEFRVNGDRDKDLKRTAQNFRVTASGSAGGSSAGSGSGGSGGSGHSAGNTYGSQFNDDSWTQDEKGWRCRKPDGTWLSDTWQELPYQGTTGWYHFNAEGYMETGWFCDNGKWYYLNPISDGTRGLMCTGWKLLDNVWYYFNENSDGTKGARTENTWAYLPYNGTTEWYYFNGQGQMMTGWLTEGDKKYYLHPIADGTRGKMYAGWQNIDGVWYYFNEESDGARGALVKNAWVGGYYVNQDGAWIGGNR